MVDLPSTVCVVLAGFIGALLAWSIGANDVANAFGTSVGAKVVTVRQAIIIAAIFEFLGAVLMGSHVADTLKTGIMDFDDFDNQDLSYILLGMTCAMIGSFVMVFAATMFSLPVSGTHATIGAIVGYTVIANGFDAVKWLTILKIASSWVISPAFSGAVSLCIFLMVKYFILRKNRYMRTLWVMPFFYAGTVAINIFMIFFNSPIGILGENAQLPWYWVIFLAVGLGLLVGIVVQVGKPYIEKWALARYETQLQNEALEQAETDQQPMRPVVKNESGFYGETPLDDDDDEEEEEWKPEVVHMSEEEGRTEQLFSFLQILTAIFGAFAHGANDIANAIGPFAMVWAIYYHCQGPKTSESGVPLWILASGGVFIVLGLATFGYRVMKTIGENLTKVTPSKGFTIELGAALTVLVGSRLGLPLSTTHCKVGSVVGVGLAGGADKVNWGMLVQVAAGWVITVPVAGVVTAVVYALLNAVFYFTLPERCDNVNNTMIAF